MPHGITLCYLPPGRGDITALTPTLIGTVDELLELFRHRKKMLMLNFAIRTFTFYFSYIFAQLANFSGNSIVNRSSGFWSSVALVHLNVWTFCNFIIQTKISPSMLLLNISKWATLLTTAAACKSCWHSSVGFGIYRLTCSVHRRHGVSPISSSSTACEISPAIFRLSLSRRRRFLRRLGGRVYCRAWWCCWAWQRCGWSVLPQQPGC